MSDDHAHKALPAPEHVAATDGNRDDAHDPSDVNARLDRIEAQMNALIARLDADRDRTASSSEDETIASADRSTRGAWRPDFDREKVAARVQSGVTSADATVRDWFDRRPFVFMSALFVAALVVFQIID